MRLTTRAVRRSSTATWLSRSAVTSAIGDPFVVAASERGPNIKDSDPAAAVARNLGDPRPLYA